MKKNAKKKIPPLFDPDRDKNVSFHGMPGVEAPARHKRPPEGFTPADIRDMRADGSALFTEGPSMKDAVATEFEVSDFADFTRCVLQQPLTVDKAMAAATDFRRSARQNKSVCQAHTGVRIAPLVEYIIKALTPRSEDTAPQLRQLLTRQVFQFTPQGLLPICWSHDTPDSLSVHTRECIQTLAEEWFTQYLRLFAVCANIMRAHFDSQSILAIALPRFFVDTYNSDRLQITPEFSLPIAIGHPMYVALLLAPGADGLSREARISFGDGCWPYHGDHDSRSVYAYLYSPVNPFRETEPVTGCTVLRPDGVRIQLH